jgi:tetratricopeptide (TPR) repeat protein
LNPAVCKRVLLLALLAGTAPLWAASEPLDSARDLEQSERSYRDAIRAIETSHGAYGADLPEQILSLGHTLQNQGRHREAVELFKRGVHLSRINDGLYSPQQLPLLQGQIASHIALGQYADADERQHYMYRVQVRSMEQGELRAQALMQQARWQYNAYHLGLGAAGFTRLMSMWDLYRLALNDIIDREGQESPLLLPPLTGMLQAQYLIADYKPEASNRNRNSRPHRLKRTRGWLPPTPW